MIWGEYERAFTMVYDMAFFVWLLGNYIMYRVGFGVHYFFCYKKHLCQGGNELYTVFAVYKGAKNIL